MAAKKKSKPAKKIPAPVKKAAPKRKKSGFTKEWQDLKKYVNPEADLIAVLQKGILKMKAIQKSALIALAAAASALSAAAQALASTADEEGEAPAASKPAAPAKKPEPPPFECKETVDIDGELRSCSKTTPHGAGEHQFNKPKPAAAPAKKPAASKPAEEKPKEAAAGDAPLLEQAIAASKGFNELFGREELVKVLKKYLPEGKKTLPDVPEDKLPALIAELKG